MWVQNKRKASRSKYHTKNVLALVCLYFLYHSFDFDIKFTCLEAWEEKLVKSHWGSEHLGAFWIWNSREKKWVWQDVSYELEKRNLRHGKHMFRTRSHVRFIQTHFTETMETIVFSSWSNYTIIFSFDPLGILLKMIISCESTNWRITSSQLLETCIYY